MLPNHGFGDSSRHWLGLFYRHGFCRFHGSLQHCINNNIHDAGKIAPCGLPPMTFLDGQTKQEARSESPVAGRLAGARFNRIAITSEIPLVLSSFQGMIFDVMANYVITQWY
jgi:hypothetical protein